MRIVKEIYDDVLNVDLLLTKNDIADIMENVLLAKEVKVSGQKISLGIALDLENLNEEEYDDAT